MKRPAFQFYPADWRSNANLRRCTHAERGIWIELMCLLHDAEEYGVLRWPLAEIAQAAGCKVAELRSLVAKGVLKGADVGSTCEAFVYVPRSGGRDGTPVELIPEQRGPVWFSSRMVRDEYVRLRRGTSTQFGGDPEAPRNEAPKPRPKPTPKGGFGGGKGHGPSSASSPSVEKPPTPDGVAPPVARPPDVAEGHWRDWLAVRKAKRGGPVTETALDGVRREALKAGISLDEAVRISAARSWIGFRADWDWRSSPPPQPALTPAAARGAGFMARIGGHRAPPNDDPRTIDGDFEEAPAPRLAAGGG